MTAFLKINRQCIAVYTIEIHTDPATHTHTHTYRYTDQHKYRVTPRWRQTYGISQLQRLPLKHTHTHTPKDTHTLTKTHTHMHSQRPACNMQALTTIHIPKLQDCQCPSGCTIMSSAHSGTFLRNIPGNYPVCIWPHFLELSQPGVETVA